MKIVVDIINPSSWNSKLLLLTLSMKVCFDTLDSKSKLLFNLWIKLQFSSMSGVRIVKGVGIKGKVGWYEASYRLFQIRGRPGKPGTWGPSWPGWCRSRSGMEGPRCRCRFHPGSSRRTRERRQTDNCGQSDAGTFKTEMRWWRRGRVLAYGCWGPRFDSWHWQIFCLHIYST